MCNRCTLQFYVFIVPAVFFISFLSLIYFSLFSFFPGRYYSVGQHEHESRLLQGNTQFCRQILESRALCQMVRAIVVIVTQCYYWYCCRCCFWVCTQLLSSVVNLFDKRTIYRFNMFVWTENTECLNPLSFVFFSETCAVSIAVEPASSPARMDLIQHAEATPRSCRRVRNWG